MLLIRERRLGVCTVFALLCFFRPGFGGSDLAVTYPAQAQAT